MSKETIRVGLDEAPPIPLHTSLAGGSFAGYEVDLLKQLAARLEFEVIYSEAPWPELLEQLQTGNIDAICSAATVTTDRQQYLRFSEPYLTFHLALVCRQDHLLTVEQLHEHPVGVRAGTTAETYLMEQLHQPPAILSNSNEELYNLLLNGIIHGIIDDSPIAQAYLQVHPELTIASLLPGPASQYAIAFSPTNTALAEKINNALRQLSGTGFLGQLEEKWFGTRAGE